MEPQRRSAESGRMTQTCLPSFAAVCSELLASLGRAVRLTALYRATHPMAADAIRDAFNLLDMAFVTGKRDRIAVSLVEGRWFCEETLVPSGVQSAEPLRRMFKAQSLRSLSFERGLRPFELSELCEAASTPAGPGEPGALSDHLAKKGIIHIALELARFAPTATQALAALLPTPLPPAQAEPSRPAPDAAARPSAPVPVPFEQRPSTPAPLAAPDANAIPGGVRADSLPLAGEALPEASLVKYPYPAPASESAAWLPDMSTPQETPPAESSIPAPVEKSAPEAPSAGVASSRSFGSLLKSLVEFAVSDPKQRIQIFEEAARMVKDSIEQRVEDATKTISQEKRRVVGQQARTEKVIETVADGKVIVDKDGKVLMMNPAAEELSGKRLADVAGRHIMESVTPGEHMVAMAKDLSAEPGLSPDVEVGGDQEVGRALRRSMAVVEDDSGRVVGTYSALPDVVKFRETLRLQEEFLSRVTHDLQAPLASINCALELLSERAAGALGPDENGFLDVCLRNSQQLGSMIREILDFSKLRAGKMAIRPAPASVTGMLKEAVDSLLPWAGNKGISLSFRAPSPDLMVMADHQRIVQVLTNLISNAIKFTPEGGRIVAAAAPKPDKHGHVVCAVRDTGCGIPTENLKRLFEKFSQVANNDGSQPGVGLGLALVSEFIKLHGGTVWVESEEGKGSTFYFTLPSEERQSAGA